MPKNGSKKRLDIRTGSRTKIARQKENAREENRQVSEAHRRRDAAKSVQHRIVTRLACVVNRSPI